MNYQDYLAALDRLRRVKTDEPLSEIYGKPLVCPEDIRTDKATVYDAEHDDTPATVEWLESIGFVHDGGRSWRLGSFRFEDTSIKWLMVRSFGDIVANKPNPTRGDVLRLLGVFSERKVRQ